MRTYVEGGTYRTVYDDRKRTGVIGFIAVKCTAIQNGYAWFVSVLPHNGVHSDYKYNLKTGKAYTYNIEFASWDTMEDEITEQFMGD